jgi:UDP-N-acetylglucosamine--N-acetylmuramyl-(pentapeptide) pyrophosphoryl-undecaprenol N-acetylglucosamine transferase
MITAKLEPRRLDADSVRLAGARRPVRLALAGGGTGGHIVPGLHLLDAIPAAELPADVVWFTSGRAVEERVLGAARASLARLPFERVALEIEPRGGGAPSRSRLVVHTPPAVLAARRALIAHRSDVLVGLGGFTSLPPALAAKSLGIPVVLLEVNAHAGAATRWLGRLSRRVAHAWRATLPHGEDARHRFVGPPLAASYARHAQLSDVERERAVRSARIALGFDPARPVLVVLGGSQGSRALNTFIRTHASAFGDAGVSILHQTGPGKLGEAAPALDRYRAVEYVEDVHQALAAATIALVRGGASTLAEVAAMRVPCFVAPYPGHADMHQLKNAAELGQGARVVHDSELNDAARDAILSLALEGGAADRLEMQRALARAVPTDAAARLWHEITSSIPGDASAS